MSSTPLRASLIRLAHAQPELRPALLPLLKEAAGARVFSRADWFEYQGDGIESFNGGGPEAPVDTHPVIYELTFTAPTDYAVNGVPLKMGAVTVLAHRKGYEAYLWRQRGGMLGRGVRLERREPLADQAAASVMVVKLADRFAEGETSWFKFVRDGYFRP